MAKKKDSEKKPMAHLEYIAQKDKELRIRLAKEEKAAARKVI